MKANTSKPRFKLTKFLNRAGSKSWRVSGTKRTGERIRENFPDEHEAKLKQIELETEFLQGERKVQLKTTRLSDSQIALAEICFPKLADDSDILRAVDFWIKRGKAEHVTESPLIDEAAKKFLEWLDDKGDGSGNGHCTLRKESRSGLKVRLNVFAAGSGNLRVNEIMPETIETFLGKLNLAPVSKDNYRRAISRFFSWAIERPRRWTATNPCREVRVARGELAPPEVLSVAQCEAILRAAEAEGLAPYLSVCLYAGLRPREASRLTWKQVNLADREIRLEGVQTKTGKARVVAICDTLLEWLKAYENKSFFPANHRRRFDRVKRAAGFGDVDESDESTANLKPYPSDVLRHSAISYYFRKTGSYGQAAEQFGNSEAIIKRHYQGRVSSTDSVAFYALRPLPKQTGDIITDVKFAKSKAA